MSTTLPKYITEKLQALRDARAAHDKNAQELTEVVTGIARCHQQKKDTEVESLEAESQWRTLFRKLRGEMTPELQAQHHSRISKRELTKEFDGLIEEMEVDKMYLHLCCGTTAPLLVDAHREALNAFAEYAMNQAADALGKVLLTADVVNACSLAKKAYSVYHDNPMDVIEQRILGGLNAHVSAAMAQKNIQHPVLSEIGLAQPEETGVLPELRTNLIKRMRIATEVAEKRKRFKERGMKS